jgi:hypothetical protein
MNSRKVAIKKPQRDIRDLFGQDIRRVGDDDIVVAGVIGIDVIVADAERGDDLELRKAAPSRRCRSAPCCR